VLGLATTSVTLLVGGFFDHAMSGARVASMSLMLPLGWVAVLKLATDAAILFHLRARGLGELKRTASLLVGELRGPARSRAALGAFGAAVAFLLPSQPALGTTALLIWLLVALGSLVGGEILERTLFFRALSAPKMPGAIGP